MSDRYLVGLACGLIADQLGDADFERDIAEIAEDDLELREQSFEETMESVHLIVGNIVKALRRGAEDERITTLLIELLKEND